MLYTNDICLTDCLVRFESEHLVSFTLFKLRQKLLLNKFRIDKNVYRSFTVETVAINSNYAGQLYIYISTLSHHI